MNQTLATEWAYARAWTDDGERAAALSEYLAHCNHDRPHSACGGCC